MGTYVMQEWPLFITIIVMMVISILCQIIVICYMAKMVKESESLEEGPQILGVWMEEYLNNQHKITNIPVFVDKKIQKISIGKYSIIRIKHFSGQTLLVMIFMAGMGACIGIIKGKTLGQILPFYIISLLAIYIHISLSGVMNLEDKKQRIRMNVTDYLQNGKMKEYIREEYLTLGERQSEYFGEKEELELKELIREILI
ncbi:MAG: hypothetical protein IKW30_04095 [Lachnospiraceae bacterium]|nr:hypothetical protein [Lachnospiraceae bacterium]